MSFTFNKETRRSLRDRIRDGINLIPGASSVVQAPANILDPKKHGQPPQPGTNLQKKSHSVDSSSPNLLVSEEMSMMKPPAQHPPSSPSYLTADADHGGGGGGTTTSVDGNATSRSGSVSSSSSTGSSPSKYRTYVVKSNDTVTSIAASFDCTPSELLRVNRLITARVLFPGQVLKIPNKRTIAGVNSGPATPPPAPQQQQQQRDDAAAASMLETLTYAQRKFLKVKVRHVTDGNGVVSGTLLITPNAVMFDPNVSDPLVIEQGAETYGIILPIEYIIAASIWSDICGMKVRGKEAFVPPGPKPALWGLDPGECNKTAAEPAASESSGEEPPSCVNSGGGEMELPEKKLDVVIESPQSSDGGGDTATESETTTIEGNSDEPEQNSQGSEDGGSSSTAAAAAAAAKLPREEVTDHPLKDPGAVIHTWYFCLTIGRPTKGGNGDANKGGCRSPRNPFCITYGQKNIVRPEFWFSVNREQVPELYKYWMFWWPHLYGEIDKQVIIDRGYDPIDWDNLDITQEHGTANAANSGGTGATRGSNDDEEQSMAQELNELTKESWEMLKQPYAKLSSFITTRGSSIMKSSSHSSQSSVSEAQTTHLHHPVGHQHQPSSSSTTSLFNSHHFSITNPMNSFFFDSFSNISPNHSVFDDTDDDDEEFADSSFEQVVTNEELRNLLAMGGEEMMTINLPDLIGGKSDILEEEDMRNITRHLTARAEGYPWTLIFTSSRDGFSLNSLYRRNMLMQEESPVIVLVQDTNSRVFGALVSCSLHPSDSFYGTGQSFLFSLRPEFNVYKWTGENLFFVKGNHDGIWIGAGDGKFGLYVDGDLNCGRTESCQTYGNPPLTEPQDFIIKTLECWAFGNFVLSTGNEGVSEVCK